MLHHLPILLMQAPSRLPTEKSLDEFEAEIKELKSDFEKTRMIICPEIHLCRAEGTRAERKKMYYDAAEPLDGPRGQRLAKIAKENDIWLIPGTVIEKGEGDDIYCTAVVYSPEGELVTSYRKCFPWRPYEPFTPGKELNVFDIPGFGRVGICVCYDIWFPEVVRQLSWMGADLIINLVQTSTCDRSKELILLQAQAITNQVYIASVNAAAPAGTGESIIIDPEGNIRAKSPGVSDFILTDVINSDEVKKVREYGVCGLHRTWAQFLPTDAPLKLPIYENGEINPATWEAKKR